MLRDNEASLAVHRSDYASVTSTWQGQACQVGRGKAKERWVELRLALQPFEKFCLWDSGSVLLPLQAPHPQKGGPGLVLLLCLSFPVSQPQLTRSSLPCQGKIRSFDRQVQAKLCQGSFCLRYTVALLECERAMEGMPPH